MGVCADVGSQDARAVLAGHLLRCFGLGCRGFLVVYRLSCYVVVVMAACFVDCGGFWAGLLGDGIYLG